MQGTEISRRLVVSDAFDRIRSAGVPAGRREIEWLLQAAEGLSRAGFVAAQNDAPAREALERFEAMVTRRMTHEPVQYILGETEFYGRPFSVTPDVLIPRPETELLVEHVVAHLSGEGAGGAPARRTGRRDRPRILDAGTGSGCIAVTLALEIPGAACIAFDVSPSALGVARENARRLGADVTFVEQDMLAHAPDAWTGAFDVLVSNPPYVPDAERDELERQVVDFEPASALFTGEDALTCYRGLARLSRAVLAPGGRLIVETHADFAGEVARVFSGDGLVRATVEQDLSGRDRIVAAVRP